MPKKCVYQSSTLAIYFTRADLDALLSSGVATVPLLVDKDAIEGTKVIVTLNYDAIKILREFLSKERAAYAKVRRSKGYVPRSVRDRVYEKVVWDD